MQSSLLTEEEVSFGYGIEPLQFIIIPTSDFKKRWDILIIALVLYNGWALPYQLAFSPNWSIELLYLDLISDC